MAKETSSTIFKGFVNSPVGIIAEFIINILAKKMSYEPLRNYFLEIQTGKTPPMNNPEYYSSNDMEWIKPSDIGVDIMLSGKGFISKNAIKDRKATVYKPNTVLFNCIGNLGRLGIIKKEASSNQQITGVLFNDSVLPEFVYYFYLTRESEFYSQSSKTTLPIINQKGLGNLDFICPDIILQKEIVRFLEYCKVCFVKETYPGNAKWNLKNEIIDFAKRTFSAYYSQRELLKEYQFQLTQIENLNHAILQEAVQGKLVAQNKHDEPASELLKRIKAEKSKSGKKEKPLPPIKLEEIPFKIPESWVWCRLGEIVKITGGGTPSMMRNDYWNGHIPWVSPKDMKNENIWDTEMKITEKGINESAANLIPIGSILIVARSGILKRKLPVAINRVECAVNQDMKVFIPTLVEMNRYMQFMFLGLEEIVLSKFVKFGMTVHSLKYTEFAEMPIPLPSLSEQKRIVAEIEKQLSKTKQLKEHTIANQQATEQLLKALLHGAFEVESA
ncbi:MAG: restriction endonuclease subunit S [Ginsengibacter sp.]